MIRRPPRSTQSRSSAASDVYKRQRLVYTWYTRTPVLHDAKHETPVISPVFPKTGTWPSTEGSVRRVRPKRNAPGHAIHQLRNISARYVGREPGCIERLSEHRVRSSIITHRPKTHACRALQRPLAPRRRHRHALRLQLLLLLLRLLLLLLRLLQLLLPWRLGILPLPGSLFTDCFRGSRW